MSNGIRWTLVGLLLVVVVVLPVVHHRASYAHSKRLRTVTEGRVYRSGQLTADGFADAVQKHGIRTIVNVQDDVPDPDVELGFFDRRTIKESELCRQLGVRYVQLSPDLIPRRQIPAHHPKAIDDWLAVLDDPTAYPILIHCKAGLHRTGCLVGVYRMEYEGWTPVEAHLELKKNGFGDSACTSANDYVKQYILTYKPRAQSTSGE